MKMGIIGYGYWGPNIARNFTHTQGIQVTSICDINPACLEQAKKLSPGIHTTEHPDEILTSSSIDAVAIVTPVFAHYEQAKKALENNKHLFIEKPFTASSRQAEELIELAEKKGLTVMVDHTFLFTGAVKKIKQVIDAGELGDLYYYDSTRMNLGLLQHDINVIWDLAPHDFSVMNYLIKSEPQSIAAHGIGHFGRDLEDVAYITVNFKNNLIAHFNVNWISPVKIRSTLIGGNKKMLVWNDLESDEKLKIYDKGVDVKTKEGAYNLLVSYRTGDMHSPKVDFEEALKNEAEYFSECIQGNLRPFNDGHAGLKVVKMLEACDQSLKNQGALIPL